MEKEERLISKFLKNCTKSNTRYTLNYLWCPKYM